MQQQKKIQKKETKIVDPAKRRTIMDMVKEFGPSNIDPKADLKELYYQDPKHGG